MALDLIFQKVFNDNMVGAFGIVVLVIAAVAAVGVLIVANKLTHKR